MKGVASEFINHRYFNDKTYCEYEDWRQMIQGKYHLVEFDTEQASNQTKMLLSKFCPEITNKVTLLPTSRHSERLHRLHLDFKLLKDDVPALPTSEGVQGSSKELDYIINLQNFKHELKTTFTADTILDYIFSFKFILDIRRNNEDPSRVLLGRDPEAYFNYLEQLNERTYLESPYYQYIIGKLSKTDKIRDLLEKRKNVRVGERMNYQKGAISAATYF